MKSSPIATTLSLLALAVQSHAAAGPVINTPPSFVQCQPAALTWAATTAPYFLSVIPGNQPTATPLERFPSTNSTSLTWTVDIAANTLIGIAITDGTGAPNFSAAFTIQASDDSSCIGKDSTSSGSSSAGGAAGTSSSSAAGGGATSSSSSSSAAAGGSKSSSTSGANGTTSSPKAGSSTSTSSAAGSSTTTTTGAASTVKTTFGGLAGAAILAALVLLA